MNLHFNLSPAQNRQGIQACSLAFSRPGWKFETAAAALSTKPHTPFATEQGSVYKPPVAPQQNTDPVHCPNCGHPAERQPINCTICGYRSELVKEYFWLYLGGAALILLGAIHVVLGTLSQGSGQDHWSRFFSGWFPLGPWPADSNWFAIVVLGVALTLLGLGFTRHFKWSFYAGIGLFCGQIFCAVKKLLSGTPENASTFLVLSVLILEVLLLLLVIRLGLALKRTPEREIYRLQRGLQKQEE